MLCAAASPGLGEDPALGRCYTMFVRIMAGIFHFSGGIFREIFSINKNIFTSIYYRCAYEYCLGLNRYGKGLKYLIRIK